MMMTMMAMPENPNNIDDDDGVSQKLEYQDGIDGNSSSFAADMGNRTSITVRDGFQEVGDSKQLP